MAPVQTASNFCQTIPSDEFVNTSEPRNRSCTWKIGLGFTSVKPCLIVC